MTKQQYTEFQANIKRNLRGLNFVSTGACPGCCGCGLEPRPCPDCDGQGTIEESGELSGCNRCAAEGTIKATEHEIESAGHDEFSRSECEACGSTLGGARYAAHGRNEASEIIHFDVCADCLYFLNYGQLDDTTMMEMENV